MASTYLSRSNGTPTSQQIFTFSAWVKRSGLNPSGNNMQLFSIYNDTSNRMDFRFQTGDTIDFYHTSSLGRLTTNRLFRDTNAWYHIVLRVDTTQATSSDRYRLYINGVQETSFSTETQPSQNANLGTNFSTFSIGDDSYGSSDYDGSMTHIHYTDGQSYAPTEFGETDATTGIWKIKTSPSVTYGTNGFFILKDGNSVTDQSGNGNNFTVGGGTLSNTEDSPSNVFNTFNPLDDYYEAGTFFNGNTTYQTGTAAGKYGRNTSTLGMTSGKFYWEVKPVSVNTSIDYYPVIGITASQITGSQDFVGKASTDYSWSTNQDGSNTVKYNNNSNISWGNHFALNSIVGVAVDLDNNKIYFSKDGVWQESGDPTSGSTGTGAAFTITSASSTPLGAYFPSLSNYDGTGYVKFEANFGNGYFGTTAVASAGTNASGIGIFEYDVPTGYTALSTKGLNL